MWGMIATWRMAVEGITEGADILANNGNAGDAIETAIEKGRKQKSEVVNAIEEKGFDSRIFTEKLCKLYEQNVRK